MNSSLKQHIANSSNSNQYDVSYDALISDVLLRGPGASITSDCVRVQMYHCVLAQVSFGAEKVEH